MQNILPDAALFCTNYRLISTQLRLSYMLFDQCLSVWQK